MAGICQEYARVCLRSFDGITLPDLALGWLSVWLWVQHSPTMQFVCLLMRNKNRGQDSQSDIGRFYHCAPLKFNTRSSSTPARQLKRNGCPTTGICCLHRHIQLQCLQYMIHKPLLSSGIVTPWAFKIDGVRAKAHASQNRHHSCSEAFKHCDKAVKLHTVGSLS